MLLSGSLPVGHHLTCLPGNTSEHWLSTFLCTDLPHLPLLLRLASALDRRPEPVVDSIRVKTKQGILSLELVPERLNQNLSLEQWSLEGCSLVLQEATGLALKVKVQQ